MEGVVVPEEEALKEEEEWVKVGFCE